MPVPKDRAEAAYSDPLNDEEGMKEWLKMAQVFYPHPFGVATECGMGRPPLEDIGGTFTICRNVTDTGTSV